MACTLLMTLIKESLRNVRKLVSAKLARLDIFNLDDGNALINKVCTFEGIASNEIKEIADRCARPLTRHTDLFPSSLPLSPATSTT